MSSIYLQINKWILIEYIFSNQTLQTQTVKALRLKNLRTGGYQFLNGNLATDITGNVLDNSVSLMGANSGLWAYHDQDTPIPIINQDNLFTIEDITSIIQPQIVYDTIRVHIVSGYSFSNIDGVILEVLWQPYQIGINQPEYDFSALSVAYLKNQTLTPNPNPIFIGNRLYDKFLEYRLPSLSSVLDSQKFSGTPPNSIQSLYTDQNQGFNPNGLIKIKLTEIASTETINSNLYFREGDTREGWINPIDHFSHLGCIIRENPEGDWIEYYPTYKGGFIEEYLSLLNQTDDWVIINQLTVFEQAGSQNIKTAAITILQENGFSEPQLYRPIIRNSAFAFSFSVDYTMRLVNRNNGLEVIRRASTTIFNPKKYGANLERINVLEGFNPIKVYNKIINTQIQGFGIKQSNPVQTKWITQFIKSSEVILDEGFGQTVQISPFDNIINWKILERSGDNIRPVDLTNIIDYIKLYFSENNTTWAIKTIPKGNPALGEIYFKIEKSLSEKIWNLPQSSVNFWVVVQTEEATTDIFNGSFIKTPEGQKIKTIVDVTKENLSRSESSEPIIGSQKDETLSIEELGEIRWSILKSNQQGYDINIPEIPGESTQIGTNPLKLIKPKI